MAGALIPHPKLKYPKQTIIEMDNQRFWEAQMQTNRVFQGMAIYADVADAVARDENSTEAQLIIGPPGVGKTKILMDALNRHGRRWAPLGGASPEALAETLARESKKKRMLVLDDGRVLKDKRNLDVLQTAITPIETRGTLTLTTRKGGKQTYDFRDALVFVLTNKPANEIPQALYSRFSRTEITFDRNDIFKYTCYLVICKGLINGVLLNKHEGRRLNLDTRREVFDMFTEHQHRLRDVSPRTLIEWARWSQKQPESWKRRILYDLEKSDTVYGPAIKAAQRPMIKVYEHH